MPAIQKTSLNVRQNWLFLP